MIASAVAVRCWGAILFGGVALVSSSHAQFGDRGDEARHPLIREIEVPVALV